MVTVGPCPSGILVRLPTLDGTVTLSAAGPGPAFSILVGRNDYKWSSGTKTLTILNAATGAVIGNAFFVVP